MQERISGFQNSRNNKVVFILSICVSLFWLIGVNTNVYRFAVTGALFEIIWLPMLILLVALPVLALILFWKDKFNLRSLTLYSALILLASLAVGILSNK